MVLLHPVVTSVVTSDLRRSLSITVRAGTERAIGKPAPWRRLHWHSEWREHSQAPFGILQQARVARSPPRETVMGKRTLTISKPFDPGSAVTKGPQRAAHSFYTPADDDAEKFPAKH